MTIESKGRASGESMASASVHPSDCSHAHNSAKAGAVEVDPAQAHVMPCPGDIHGKGGKAWI